MTDITFIECTGKPAPRQSAHTPRIKWEERKYQIVNLYQSHTLKDVVETMAEVGFIAKHVVTLDIAWDEQLVANLTQSRRQYIYQLEQWGIKKYAFNRDICSDSNGASPSSTESSDAAINSPVMPPVIDLKSLAANALSAVQTDALRNVEGPRERKLVSQKTFSPRNRDRSTGLHQQQQMPHPLPLQREVMQVPNPVLVPPIFYCTSSTAKGIYPPRQSSCQVLRRPSDVESPITQSPIPSMHVDLPPIGSPHHESNEHISLPPIRTQLGKQLSDFVNVRGKEHAMRHPRPTPSSFIGSSPGASHMPPKSNSRASPPVSPKLRILDQQQQILTPANFTTDRRSIDNVTSPKTGTFICKSAGCNAAPFRTQYLLNSHANVHSSVRSHYCDVKDCRRSEGGKGFKRKSELVRHGLVHESPGYVCPFCPNREHKYPRPDNVQR